jgi:hypothetical protein
MEPITLTILAVLAAAAGGTAIAVVGWATVRNWVWGHKVPQGTGEIVKKKLANGEYVVVAGVFSRYGAKVATQTWKARQLDSDLEGEFRNGGGKIVVKF